MSHLLSVSTASLTSLHPPAKLTKTLTTPSLNVNKNTSELPVIITENVSLTQDVTVFKPVC